MPYAVFIDVEEATRMPRRLAEEWEDLVNRVPEIEDFRTLPPSLYSELADAAQAGPVVVVNVSKLGRDSLILSPSQPLAHISLDGFFYDDAAKLQKQLDDITSTAGLRVREGGLAPSLSTTEICNSHLREMFHDLWVFVVKPVLDQLHFQVCLWMPLAGK